MTNQKFSIKCSRCLGTGIDDNVNPSVPCAGCGGDGYVESSLIDTTEVINELDWIKNKMKKILKKLELPED